MIDQQILVGLKLGGDVEQTECLNSHTTERRSNRKMKRTLFIVAVALGLVGYMLTVPATARGQTHISTASFVAIDPGLLPIGHSLAAVALIATLDTFDTSTVYNGEPTNANKRHAKGDAAQRKPIGNTTRTAFQLRT
jgi:hypothetical protein